MRVNELARHFHRWRWSTCWYLNFPPDVDRSHAVVGGYVIYVLLFCVVPRCGIPFYSVLYSLKDQLRFGVLDLSEIEMSSNSGDIQDPVMSLTYSDLSVLEVAIRERVA